MTLATRDRRIGFTLVTVGALLLTVQLFKLDLGFGPPWPLFILVPELLLLLAAGLGGASVSLFILSAAIVTLPWG